MNTRLREFETGEATIRKLNNGKFVIILCFPHASNEMDATWLAPRDRRGWRKSHMVHPSYNSGAPKQYDAFGLAFAASKKHYPHCKLQSHVSKPLATGDIIHPSKLADVQAHK